jgi:hypothetical protein
MVVISFVSACLIGDFAFAYVEAQSEGEPVEWIRDQALEFAFTALVLSLASVGTKSSLRSSNVKWTILLGESRSEPFSWSR